jgi:hypothetical protein
VRDRLSRAVLSCDAPIGAGGGRAGDGACGEELKSGIANDAEKARNLSPFRQYPSSTARTPPTPSPGRQEDSMKSLFTFAISVALVIPGLPLFAQLQDNAERQLSCDNNGHDSETVRHCEIREQSYPSIGRLNVDAGSNGAVTVKGAFRGDMLVRARVETHADSEASAAIVASQVSIDASGGQVHANGPQTGANSWWSVSYEIFVPQTTDLTLKTHNGALTISDVRGNLRFDVNNGAVHLRRVAGDVSGTTVNGAIQAELAGGAWEGRQLDVGTHNGAVTVTVAS